MQTYYVGSALGKKIVDISEDLIILRNKRRVFSEIKIEDVETVFLSQPSKHGDGQVFFSYDGKYPEDLFANKESFTYNDSQKEEVLEILEPFEGIIVEMLSVGEQTQIMAEAQLVQAKKEIKETVSPKNGNDFLSDNNSVRYPKCKGTNIEYAGNNKKAFSVGKALGGAILTGGIGAIAGFAGKKGKTDKWYCRDCGNVFNK